jgi:O-antigen/teichoic acid export membrane protein
MFKKVSSTTLFYAYVQAVAFFVFMLTAKYYGADGRGVFASVTSIGTFAASLMGFSIGSVIPYFIVQFADGRDLFFRDRLFSILSIIFFLTFVAFTGLVVTYLVRPSLFGSIAIEYLLAAAISLPYFMWIGSNDILFSSAGKIRNQNIIGISLKTAFLITCFTAMFFFKTGLLGFLLIYGCFNLLQFLAEMIFLLRVSEARFFINFLFIKELVKKGVLVHAATIAGLLNTTFSVLVLNYYAKNDMRDVGNLNFASQLSSLLMIVPIVVNRYMYSEITANGIKEGWEKQKKVIRYCLLFLVAVAIAAYFLIVPFCSLWGKEFTDAIPVFRIFLLIMIPSAFCTMMQSQWYSRGYFKKMSAINISVGVVGALITLYAIPRYGMYGAVITTAFTYTIFFIINIIFYHRIDAEKLQDESSPVVLS